MVGERAGGRLPMRESIGLESVDSSMEFVKVKIPEVCGTIRNAVCGTRREDSAWHDKKRQRVAR
jgi:hypothetical protein